MFVFENSTFVVSSYITTLFGLASINSSPFFINTCVLYLASSILSLSINEISVAVVYPSAGFVSDKTYSLSWSSPLTFMLISSSILASKLTYPISDNFSLILIESLSPVIQLTISFPSVSEIFKWQSGISTLLAIINLSTSTSVCSSLTIAFA